MISIFFKILFSLTTISGCLYSINTFGFSIVLIGVIICCIAILASTFIRALRSTAKMLGLVIAIMSLFCFILLMLAGMTGGSFNLSASNQVLAAFLLFIVLFGLTSFFWSVPKKGETTLIP